MKKIIITVISLFFVILTGCPNYPEERAMRGKTIANYPSWATGHNSTGAINKWQNWQDTQAKELRSLVPEEFTFEDGTKVRNYEGKYRLELGSQNVFVEFENGYDCLLLYLFVADLPKDDHDSYITIPQNSPDRFNFSGTAKYGYEGEDIAEFTCHLVQKAAEDTGKYSFTYTLHIAGRDVVKDEFYVYTEQWFEDKQNPVPLWLPPKLYVRKDGSTEPLPYACNFVGQTADNHYTSYTGFFSPSPFNGLDTARIEKGVFLPSPPYHGGMKQVSLDESQRKVVYQLFDGAPNSPQYVELHRNTDTTVQFTWFNLPENQTDTTAVRQIVKEETLYVQE